MTTFDGAATSPCAQAAEVNRLRAIEARARVVVETYLRMDTENDRVTYLHPAIDNLRMACGIVDHDPERKG